jgi:hypothetical protein
MADDQLEDVILRRAYKLIDERAKTLPEFSDPLSEDFVSDQLTQEDFDAVEKQLLEEGFDRQMIVDALNAIGSDGALDTF